MENKNSDQVVYIKDLLFAMLYQWRRIVLAAVIFAVILGAFSYISQSQQAANIPSEAEQLKLTEEYAQKKASIERRLNTLTAQIESQSNYIEHSPLMQLDPNSIYRAYGDFSVQTDYQIQPDKTYQDIDHIYTISHAYCTLLSNEAFLTSVAELINVPIKYASEVLDLHNNISTTRSFKVVVTTGSREHAQAIFDLVTEVLNTATPKIAQDVSAHELNLINTTIREEVDTSLADKQTAALDRLNTLKTDLETQKSAASALSAPSFNATISKKKIVLFAVIGGILGAVLVAGCAFFCHISSDKVYSARTLRCSTGVKVLGCTYAAKKCVLDRWLRKLEGRIIDEAHTEAVIANVRNYCADTKRLLVTGCSGADAQCFAQALKAVGVEADSCGDLLTSADALNSLRSYDAVLLVTTCGCSRYSSVRKTLSCVNDLGIRIVGCVVVGG